MKQAFRNRICIEECEESGVLHTGGGCRSNWYFVNGLTIILNDEVICIWNTNVKTDDEAYALLWESAENRPDAVLRVKG